MTGSKGNFAISAHGVAKRYQVFGSERARLMHALFPRRHADVQEVWALRDVGFEIRRGESVAIIGRNGSGKSTLLQILAGTLEPTAGQVKIDGRISALLELGSGFNPEFSGRENVMLNGLLLGLSRKQVLDNFDRVTSFADIGDAIERPVKTYSSGMVMRLAFAVQTVVDPDVLVIDEALSVGDFFFQQKCFAFIRSLVDRGTTLLFVSHDMSTVRDLCSRAIYLRKGLLDFAGDTHVAIQRYLSERTAGPAFATRPGDAASVTRTDLEDVLRSAIWTAPATKAGSGASSLIAVALHDERGVACNTFKIGEAVHVKVAYVSFAVPPQVSIVLHNKFNQVVIATGSSRIQQDPPGCESGASVIFEMSLKLAIESGNYSITVHLGYQTGPNQGEVIDSSPQLGPISVQWDYENEPAPFLGMFGLPVSGHFNVVDAEPSAVLVHEHVHS